MPEAQRESQLLPPLVASSTTRGKQARDSGARSSRSPLVFSYSQWSWAPPPLSLSLYQSSGSPSLSSPSSSVIPNATSIWSNAVTLESNTPSSSPRSTPFASA